jgi:hypothetical protein
VRFKNRNSWSRTIAILQQKRESHAPPEDVLLGCFGAYQTYE